VRHGALPEREVMTGTGPVPISRPKADWWKDHERRQRRDLGDGGSPMSGPTVSTSNPE